MLDTTHDTRLSRGQRICVRRILKKIRQASVHSSASVSERHKQRASVGQALLGELSAAEIVSSWTISKQQALKAPAMTDNWCSECYRNTPHKNGVCTRHESVYCSVCRRSTLRFDGSPCRSHISHWCSSCAATRNFVDGLCEKRHSHRYGSDW